MKSSQIHSKGFNSIGRSPCNISNSCILPYITEPNVPSEDILDVIPLSKDEYLKTAREKRKEFIHSNFRDVLKKLFETLQDDAVKLKSCNRQVTFEIPEHFDEHKTEAMLNAYFVDLGYKPLSEPKIKSEDSKNKITITLT